MSCLTQTHPAMGAITGLSCTAICRGCPRQYQMRQVSPCTPTPLLTSQQPTCVAQVRPFRAALTWDFHPFGIYRVALVAQSPVSVSPNINPFFDAGSDRKRESHPLAPLVCRASAITRTRLQAMPSNSRLATVEAPFPGGDELGGAQSGVTVCTCGGWRPPHSDHPGVCGVARP